MIKTKGYISGSEWWINSENLSFKDILIQSRIPNNWSKYNSKDILSINSVLKPVNNYVFNLYAKPKVVSIINNLVTFRQKTHAEIWVEEKDNNVLYALDKCHQRQFYPSLNNLEANGCFLPTYRFYIPWFINKDTEIKISGVLDEETPFYVKSNSLLSNKIEDFSEYVDAQFVDFKIKNTGKYSLREKYAIISKNTAMYDMSVVLTNEEIEGLGYQYGDE